MPAPYSYDLRKKVLDAIDDGMSKTVASKIFKISRNTINLWLARREETGDYRAKVGYQQGYGAKITMERKFQRICSAPGKQNAKRDGPSLVGENQRHDYWEGVKKEQLYSKKKLMDIEKEMKKKGKNFCKKSS